MKNYILQFALLLSSATLMAQTGHIMQGIGAVNMSMGGAATAQPLDISGPLHWNPAGISVFDDKILSFNAGFFFSSPELCSTVPTPDGEIYTGITKDDRGMSVMPALGMVFGKQDSRHTLGISAFGISGFGVTFPENMENPINMPQYMGGFGHVESDYMLMQVGFAYAYEISGKFSVGLAPTFNYAELELAPNPLAPPGMTTGFPVSDRAGATGFGFQTGLYYRADNGIKLGASYKSPQFFSDFEFTNTYLDGTEAPDVSFNMDYPAIYSIGLGYSTNALDLAADYRLVDYENTDGFEKSGWTQFGSVAGFGWENISIVSAGIQYKGFNKMPLRLGYTYSSNPINRDLAFFSVPATAIIKHAFQLGAGFDLNANWSFNLTYHQGLSSGATSGPMLSPLMIDETNPYGEVPGCEVSYEMNTNMIMFGLNHRFF